MQKRKTEFVSAHLTPAAREALRKLTISVSGDIERRVSMSTVLEALIKTAEPRREELLSHLPAQE